MQHTIEQSHLFAPIAWFIVIAFAVFVGNLALTLDNSLAHLSPSETVAELER